MKDYKDLKAKYYRTISMRLKSALETSGMKQADILTAAESLGFSLRQSSLSKAFNNDGSSISVLTLSEIAQILKIDMNDLLSFSSETKMKVKENLNDTSARANNEFITNPTDFKMRAYLNSYHIWFFPTKSADNKLLKGNMSIYASDDNQKTLVRLSFKTGKSNSEGEITKEYYGSLIISPIMSAAYCLLQNDEIGEISFVLFSFIPVLYEKHRSSIALVLTSCAGGKRLPTAHRMIMSIDDIPDEKMDILKGQLYLNDSEILISEERMAAFLKDKRLSNEFVECFKPKIESSLVGGLTPSLYYHFNESLIRAFHLDENDKLNAIHLIRQYAVSHRYNKVGRCNELLMKTLSYEQSKEERSQQE